MICKICENMIFLNYDLEDIYIYSCKNCNHRVSFFKKKNKARDEYNENYYIEKHKNWFENPNYSLFNFILHFVKKNNIKNILDLGCGKGDFLKYMNLKSKLKLTGIDITKNKNLKSIKFIKGDLHKYTFNEKFDLIVNLAVIEHIDDVNKFVAKINSLLNKNGHTIIMTVNQNSLIYKISRFLYSININEPFIRLYDKHHLNHFSNKSLLYLLKKHKFEIISKYFQNHNLNSVDFNKANFVKTLIFKVAIFILFKIENFFNHTTLQTIIAKKID